jgi:hypothetical protein
MKRKYTTRTATLYAEERLMVTLSGLLLLVAFALYMYFLSASVLNVVMRQEIDAEIHTTQTKISSLESRYILAKTNLTEEVATAHGLLKADQKTFITKTKANLAFGGK